MKAYENIPWIEYPDVADIQSQARKSSVGRFRRKGGDFKGYIRRVANKAQTRRYLKRKDKAISAKNWKKEIYAIPD
jgi:hypothetical protein